MKHPQIPWWWCLTTGVVVMMGTMILTMAYRDIWLVHEDTVLDARLTLYVNSVQQTLDQIYAEQQALQRSLQEMQGRIDTVHGRIDQAIPPQWWTYQQGRPTTHPE